MENPTQEENKEKEEIEEETKEDLNNAQHQIKIKAIDKAGNPIANLKDYIVLEIEKNHNLLDRICCDCEEEKGNYVFNIQQDFDIFSKVYVRLKDNPPILQDCDTKNNPNQTQEDNPQQYIIYNKESHFLHSSCTQINFLGSMICNSKVVPFTFATINQTHFIGLIKAYKAENALSQANQRRDFNQDKDSRDSLEFEDSLYSSTSFSLPTQDSYFLPNDTTSLDYPHLEIYTLDKEQRIRLKAFLYEKQRFYVAKKDLKDESIQIARRYKEEQGNITKNIL